MPNPEIQPPWISYPGLPLGHFFWRDAGQPWFAYVWEPFWLSLNPQQQADYLVRWQPSDVWREFYFDPEFRNWLYGTDY